MIRFIELTAPESSLFRQAKIVSIEVNDGDTVNEGDTLFIVKSGDKEVPLPASLAGRVTEVIVMVDQLITLSTPLVLFETEVEKEATKEPSSDIEVKVEINDGKDNSSKDNDTDVIDVATIDKGVASNKQATNTENKDKKSTKQRPVKSDDKQQQLNLDGTDNSNGTDVKNKAIVNDVVETINATQNDKKETSTATEPKNITESEPMTDKTNNNFGNTNIVDVAVPDIGGDSAKVVDILVSVGDQVTIEQGLVTLESDKASMDVPSSVDGEVQEITINIDDSASEGTVIAKIKTVASSADATQTKELEQSADEIPEQEEPAAPSFSATAATAPVKTAKTDSVSSNTNLPNDVTNNIAVNNNATKAHASPSIRRFARELGVDLGNVIGTGRKGRISKADVKAFVKQALTTNANTSGQNQQASNGIPAMPEIDFSKFGQIEVEQLNKIKRATATNLHRSWLNVPHVTHNDEADISDMDEFRKEMNAELARKDKNSKLSPLAFVVKAVVSALQAYPQFNSSLSANGEELILKKYYNIGIAVDTPNGLVVPVIKDADKLGIVDIAKKMTELSSKARDKKLSISDLSGASFSISSLGGIGGTSFTPIVNAPEVAILGVSRTKTMPVWDGKDFQPGLMLPLSLSYDHRVIDGAEAARFARHIAAALEDVRRLTI